MTLNKKFQKIMENRHEKGLNADIGEDTTRRYNRTNQKSNRADRNMESNTSPDIPDTGETSKVPGLPSGGTYLVLQHTIHLLSQRMRLTSR